MCRCHKESATVKEICHALLRDLEKIIPNFPSFILILKERTFLYDRIFVIFTFNYRIYCKKCFVLTVLRNIKILLNINIAISKN